MHTCAYKEGGEQKDLLGMTGVKYVARFTAIKPRKRGARAKAMAMMTKTYLEERKPEKRAALGA